MSKQQIFDATWELIKAEGIKGVTTRKIASRAATNSALVNYYFGSKEQLLNEVVKHYLESFREAFKLLDDTTLPPIARLRRFLLSYAALLLEHPELALRLLSQEDLFASHVEYVEFLKRQGVEKLLDTIREIVGPQPQEKILLMHRQMAGAIFFPLVIRGSFNPVIRAALEDADPPLEEQIDLFLARYFAPVQTEP